MIEFKQIIGQGARVYGGKDFFTIWGFVKAHENFKDPEWDGQPEDRVERLQRPSETPTDPPEPPDLPDDEGEGEGPKPKLVLKLADGQVRKIRYIASTTYWIDGKIVSSAEFLERLFGDLSDLVADEDQLRKTWSEPDNRERFLSQIAERGYDREKLDDIRQLVDAPDSDLFDVLSYILYTHDPKTRHDRAEAVRSDAMTEVTEDLRPLLLGILLAYEDGGEDELSIRKLGHFLTARYGSVSEGKSALGGFDGIRRAFLDLQRDLYKS